MRRPEQHEIDTAAQRLFERALPISWVARKQEPDYGIDYVVEVFADNRSTGLKFDVQLKGTRTPRVRGDVLSFPLEVAHLEYYLRLREPVFLVVADIASGRAVWMFLQHYVLENLVGVHWQTQKSVTIRMPVGNRLDNTANLAKAVREADWYMAGVHPVALDVAVGSTQRKLESKDPRFAVQVRVDGDVIACEFRAKETVRAAFRFTGTERAVRRTLDELLGKGQPVDFAPGEISVEGLPAVEDAFASGGTLQWYRHIPGSLQIRSVDASGVEGGRVDSLVGEFVGGLSEMTLRAWLGESPLEVGFSIAARDLPRISPMRLAFQIGRWAGQPLRQLDHFDQIESVFGIGPTPPHLMIRCFLRGNHLFTAEAKLGEEQIASSICWIVRTLQKAREVAVRLNVDPPLPDDMTDEELREAEALHAVLFGGGYRRRAAGERFRVTIDRPKIGNIRRALTGNEGPVAGTFTLAGGPQQFSFFRTHVTLDAVTFSLTHARLEDAAAVGKRLARDKPLRLTWAGSTNSELIIQQSKDMAENGSEVVKP